MSKFRLLFLGCVATLLIAGCATAPRPPAGLAPVEPTPARPPEPVRFAQIKGSEESSLLLDNFTAFVAAVDGQPVAAGRAGWAAPLQIGAGRHTLTVQFIRGVFTSRAELTFEAAPDASYEVRFTTDAQLFGHNSFCDFWIVDLGTGLKVTAMKQAPVTKGG